MGIPPGSDGKSRTPLGAFTRPPSPPRPFMHGPGLSSLEHCSVPRWLAQRTRDSLALGLEHQPCLEKPSFPVVSCTVSDRVLSLPAPLKEPLVHPKQTLVLNPVVCGLDFLSTADPLACSSPCPLQRCFIGIPLNNCLPLLLVMGSWNPDTPPGIPLQRQVQSAFLRGARHQAVLPPLPSACLVPAVCTALCQTSRWFSSPLCPLSTTEV